MFFDRLGLFNFEADKGTAGGAQTGTGGDAAGTGTSATTAAAETGTPPEEKKFTQADVDRILKERLERAGKAAKDQADAEAAKKNGEWQKLAEQREQELATTQAQLREERVRSIAARLGISDTEYAVFLVQRAGKDSDPEQVLGEYAKKNGVQTATTAAQTGANTAAGTTGAGTTNVATNGAGFTRSQLRDPKFYAAHREEILQAAREGRIRED